MTQLECLRSIIHTYRSHGWQPHSVLMRDETQAELQQSAATASSVACEAATSFDDLPVRSAAVDAVWFMRASGAPNRTAYELRHVSNTPFALFEIFEPDESEEDRAGVRREMEARLIEHLGGEAAAI